ncbi:ATP-dependent DNA helicase [uncultured Arcanobacterium sp.]|uniref:ATP-dependent helicase n=1 Tax=uncultured Arcanobacterium sp. TaxID=487520 RepID=UPI0026225A9D|nr:ATP-dependent DNA helicase [uncultured Arcanobacterium sp.]
MSSLSFTDFVSTLKFPPTSEQETVIRSTAPVILVVAGAGSGKTATMTQRIAWKVASGEVAPQEVLGLTFTRKAARELAERASDSLQLVDKKFRIDNSCPSLEPNEQAAKIHAQLQRPTVSTYNAFASDLATSYAMLIGENARARLITNAEKWLIMQNIVHNFSAAEDVDELRKVSADTVIKAALALAEKIISNQLQISEARSALLEEAAATEDLLSGKSFNESKSFQDTEAEKECENLNGTIEKLRNRAAILQMVEKYFQYKKEHSLIEYADQVAIAGRVLREVPEIGEELRKKYKLIILDEYQDTSVIQAQFLADAFRGSYSLCAVGDPNQAIYGWRGASANALSDFMEVFSVAEENVLSLSTAFRNGKNILAAANRITKGFSKEPDISKVYEKVENFNLQERPWLSKPARITTPAMEKLHKKLPQLNAAPGAAAGKVLYTHRILQQDSYQAIAQNIAKYFQTASGSGEEKSAGKSLTAAVLLRENKYIPDVVEALRAENLEVEVFSGEAIITFPEIKAVRSLLRIAIDTARNDDLLYLENFFHLGAKDLYAFSRLEIADNSGNEEDGPRKENANTRVEYLDFALKPHLLTGWEKISTAGQERFCHIAKLVREIRQNLQLPLPELIRLAEDLLDLPIYAASRGQGSAQVRTALQIFINMGEEYAAAQERTALRDFLDWLELAVEKESGDTITYGVDAVLTEACTDINPKQGVVQVLTMHSAKGLEWDIVAIPEMVKNGLKEFRYTFWNTDRESLPISLRLDKKYIPNFQVAGAEIPQIPFIDEADPEYYRAGVLCWLYFHYKNRLVPKYTTDEARRLAYVAFTRPKKLLILASYTYKDEKNEKVLEIAQDCLKHIKEGTEWDENPLLRDLQENYSMFLAELFDAEAEIAAETDFIECDAENEGVFRTEEHLFDMKSYLSWCKKRFPQWGEAQSAAADADAAEDSAANTPKSVFSELPVKKLLRSGDDLRYWPVDVQRSLESAAESETEITDTAAQELLAQFQAEAELLVAEKEAAEQDTEELELGPYLTASSLVAISRNPQEFLLQHLRPLPARPLRAARRGTAVHGAIAEYFSTPAVLDIDAVAEPGEMPLDAASEITAADEKKLYRRFRDSPFATWQPVAIEQPVEVTLNDMPVRCVIDAVFDTSEIPGHRPFTIVDWKTGKRPGAADLPSCEYQLAIYRLAWAHARDIDLEDIEVCFYYLGEKDPQRRLLRGKVMSREEIIANIDKNLRAAQAALFQ